MEFKQSNIRSVGVEWEIQIINPESFNLSNEAIHLLKEAHDHPNLQPEFIQNTVEIVSDPCANLKDLNHNLADTLTDLLSIGNDIGLCFAGAGTHPFSTELATLTPKPRYLSMEVDMGLLAHTQVTFGQHVHFGVRSGEEAVNIVNHLLAYVPVIVALSANSPFWRGYETGHSAYRHRILSAARSYGLPPTFVSWQECSDFLDLTMATGVYQSINDIHWDIRARPDLGTVEVRLMDAQSTLQETCDLAAFVYLLMHYIADQIEHDSAEHLLTAPMPWLQKENCYQAAHLGVDAKYISKERGKVEPIRPLIEEVISSLSTTALALDQTDALKRLEDRLQSSRLGYQRQLDNGWKNSTEKVVEALVLELDQSCPK